MGVTKKYAPQPILGVTATCARQHADRIEFDADNSACGPTLVRIRTLEGIRINTLFLTKEDLGHLINGLEELHEGML